MKTDRMILSAFAKINLFLEIVSKRPDGYHGLKSVMQTVSLSDRLTVSAHKSDKTSISISCDDPKIPSGRDNIVWKAAELFCRDFGNYEIDVEIKKNIPSAAGLAGGSADAAAALIALNQITERGLSESELCRLGEKLGADVPFCIVKGTCLCEGVGEKLTKLDPIPDASILIAVSDEAVSTPQAYRRLDERFGNFENYIPREDKLARILSGISKKDITAVSGNLFNIFENTVLEEKPKASEYLKLMKDHGALGVLMSGSGPSVFGIFVSEEDAENAAKILEKIGARCFICKTI